MKKTYQNPTTEMTMVEPHLMAAASRKGITFNDNDGTGTIEVQNGSATGEAMGRKRHDIWEDDEEMEEEY